MSVTTAENREMEEALQLHRQGRLDEAAEIYRRMIREDHENIDALNLLGIVARQQGDLRQSRDLFSYAIRISPGLPDLHRNLGETLEAGNDPAGAVDCYGRALQLAPLDGDVHYLKGAALKKLGRVHEAVESMRQATLLCPEWAEAYLGLGIALQMVGEVRQAIAAYRRAAVLDATLVQVHYNLGTALKELGEVDEALSAFREAVHLDPAHGDANWNLSLLYLLTGDFRQGWQRFSWRWEKRGAPQLPHYPALTWDGGRLNGRTILLHAEQGIGDSLQFVRYVPLVAACGGRVVVECQRGGVKRILKSVAGAALVVEQGDPLPAYDCHCSLMDLPAIFATDVDSIPGQVPYLEANAAEVCVWREMVSADPGRRIGLVWAGNPKHHNDRNRSIGADLFSPLAGLAGFSYYRLQLPAGGTEPSGLKMIDLTGLIRDFADTAALICNMDLVITVDTAVAHLAGGLGTPVWTLLPFDPDWRWMLNRSDSPWYPTMRLFRQREPGNWQGVMSEVRDALKIMLP